jgi:hypothetical protein
MAYTTIDDPSAYFQTALWTGNGSARSITLDGNSDMQPDWVWIKRRNSARNHAVLDSVRGGSKQLKSNSSDAEGTDAQLITSFDSDGFSLGTSSDCNSSSDTFVGWCWKASGSTASNTDGSITSTVSASTTAGFSIVSYTGTGANATVGHGLGAAPQVFIIKNRSASGEWPMYHEDLTNAEQVSLFWADTGAVSGTSALRYNNTAPTSSVFSLGSSSLYNGSGNNMIAYCFAEKQGYSKMGSYIGNGNADGTFIFTGFKPAFLLIKNKTSSSTNWHIYDNKRLGYNVDNDMQRANLNNADQTDDDLDILSNGFKLRRVTSALSTNGDTYIYMAFAENPFVTSTGIPTTAR